MTHTYIYIETSIYYCNYIDRNHAMASPRIRTQTGFASEITVVDFSAQLRPQSSVAMLTINGSQSCRSARPELWELAPA